MKTWVWLSATSALVACALDPITQTVADGTVRGVGLSNVEAVSTTDEGLLGERRHTVWIGQAPVCSRLREATVGSADTFGPSFLREADGGRAPVLILRTDTNAFFDTGEGEARVRGDVRFTRFENGEGGFVSGLYVASFPLDGGADETLAGSFAAPPCDGAAPGCASAPGLLVLGAVALALRRARGHAVRR